MHPIHDLSIPKRRILQPVRDALAEISAGDLASAKFVTQRYGPFVIDGNVHQIGNDLHIAGSFLGSLRGPTAELHALTPLAALPVTTAGAPAKHGDVVRVRFANAGHGEYCITGVALASTVRPGLTVASWLLNHSNVVAIEVLGDAHASGVIVPAVLGELEISAVSSGAAEADGE